ncbi:DUF1345 domain-containing protein [Oerskovia sp. KBS0722]|uniref:DUF1345 domain-containing protein n=1 Tax=Oerskovia sp. KBS0722 TaxID=1179673 RepID=UPI00110DE192|nr:DUF1345 domain-containing protein [Oerskovia sp. KBS0722]QDW62134.1 DUF1345 domain-containing protein [Oerskovia sp. KBS0722]
MTPSGPDLPSDPVPRDRLGPGPGWRLAAGVLVGVAVGTWLGAQGYLRFAVLAGWSVAALLFVVWTWAVIAPMDARVTASHATREEPSRRVAHLFILAAAVVSLVGVGLLLLASPADKSAQALTAVFAVGSVAISWAAVHTLFGLAYARQYYTGVDGGIDFNQAEPPRYLDFMYVAFTVGMSFAISDTNVTSGAIRRTALGHALLSYMFGTVIIGAVVNLVAGL